LRLSETSLFDRYIGHDNNGLFATTKGKKVHLLDPLSNIVRLGNMHNDNPTRICHGATIDEGHVSIEVKIINFSGYKLPIPNGDAMILEEALQGFVLWDTNVLQLECQQSIIIQHV